MREKNSFWVKVLVVNGVVNKLIICIFKGEKKLI